MNFLGHISYLSLSSLDFFLKPFFKDEIKIKLFNVVFVANIPEFFLQLYIFHESHFLAVFSFKFDLWPFLFFLDTARDNFKDEKVVFGVYLTVTNLSVTIWVLFCSFRKIYWAWLAGSGIFTGPG